jgi:TatD DNase family protein
MYIDTHCHLLDTRFDPDRDAAISRATEHGIQCFIEVGCDPQGWQATTAFAESHPDVFCALGVHPHEAEKVSAGTMKELESYAGRKKIVAIGEAGLDYHYEHSPRDIQKKVLLDHIALARRVKLPLTIHCRQAYQDLLAMLQQERPSDTGTYSGVIHCFSGNLKEALQLIDLGFLIGIDGPVTYPAAKDLQEIVKQIPLERIVLETDSPYLPTQGYRGQRTEPSYLSLIA